MEASLRGVGDDADLLEALITRGVLPRYAFPVDLVALWTREPSRYSRGEEVQRDLRIALSEYAPEAEVVIDGWKHRSVGLYTPFEATPRYEPDSWFYECPDCHHVQVSDGGAVEPSWARCPVCASPITGEGRRRPVAAIRPQGFRTDWTAKATRYRGGFRERAGSAGAARLSAGESAVQGESRFEGRLWVHRRRGELYAANHGRGEVPGFWICPRCGRNLDRPTQDHKRPAHPPAKCEGRPERRASLLHRFQSDVAVLALNLPETMAADPTLPRGRAAWLSLGASLLRAAAAHLQVDAAELSAGLRPWVDPAGRLSGEVFVHDTLPNGAGYAEEVANELEGILRRAYELCATCPGWCEAACYRCLLDYSNQQHHALLDRHLARDLIGYALHGVMPELPYQDRVEALGRLRHFAPEGTLRLDVDLGGTRVPGVISDPGGSSYSLWPTHALSTPPQAQVERTIRQTGTVPLFPSGFDLQRRPFWVWNRIVEGGGSL
jgi:ribosomal protein S27E